MTLRKSIEKEPVEGFVVEIGESLAKTLSKQLLGHVGEFKSLGQALLGGHSPQHFDIPAMVWPGFRIAMCFIHGHAYDASEQHPDGR